MENPPPSSTYGMLGGVAGLGFLVGIGLHALRPYDGADLSYFSFVFAASALLIVTCWQRRRWRAPFVFLFAILVGVWRFDVARAAMPYGLKPFDPKGLAYVTWHAQPSDPKDLRFWFTRPRQKFTERARSLFSADESALLTGMLYGERSMPKTLKDDFRRAGLLHLMAVSGSNMTIVVWTASFFLLEFGMSRRSAFVGLSAAILSFVLFVSPSASVVRAAIMGWLVAFAPVVGRIARPSRLLLIAAVAFTAWKPWSLLFDAGFVLSFLAMWGLLTWSRRLDERMEGVIPWKNLRQMIAASVGATLVTAPYTAWAFGQFSVWGLLTGVLAIPLVPWVMLFGILSLAVPIAPIIIPTKGFLHLLMLIARIPGRWQFGWREGLVFSWTTMVACYMGLFMILFYFRRKNRLIHSKNVQDC